MVVESVGFTPGSIGRSNKCGRGASLSTAKSSKYIKRSLAFYKVQQTDRVDDGSAIDFVNGNINKEHSIALSPPSSAEDIDLA